MDPLALGARYPDGAPLFLEVDADELIDRLAELTADVSGPAAPPWTFEERVPRTQPRLDVPTEAGWSYVVAEDDPDRDAIIGALEELAQHREMAEPVEPLLFPTGADHGNWIDEAYTGLGDDRPRYLLLAGGPDRLPFPLQVDLAAAGTMVGRVAFTGDDRVEAYRRYAAKVLRHATGDPVPRAKATVVATYGGPLDATVYSSRFLAPPVVTSLQGGGLEVTEVNGPAATKEGIRSALAAGQPALVFTATHGAGYVTGGDTTSEPTAVNGAFACAPAEPGAQANAWDWLTASELPEKPVAPGGIVVQFACFGYGTTDRTSFAAWLGNRNVVEVAEPFVSAIPQQLLADPEGPLAYVGHVDYALAHGFVEPGVAPAGGVSPRAEPFLTLVRQTASDLTPVGYALRDLHARAAALASEIASTFDALSDANLRASELQPDEKARLIDKVIRRNDAMHFLLLGDPAARVRIDG